MRMRDFDGWCERARAWLRQGRYREAELAYREAIGLRPDDVKLRLDLALVLRRQRRSADAEAVRPARTSNVPSSAATGKPSLRWSAPDALQTCCVYRG